MIRTPAKTDPATKLQAVTNVTLNNFTATFSKDLVDKGGIVIFPGKDTIINFPMHSFIRPGSEASQESTVVTAAREKLLEDVENSIATYLQAIEGEYTPPSE